MAVYGGGLENRKQAPHVQWSKITNDLEHVFEPFYSTKNLELGAGIGRHHGLGLSVALGIMHEMGGNIAVSSVPGRETTIEIKLPVDPAQPLRPEWEDAPEHLGP